MLEIAAELEGLQVGERGNTLDGGDFPILRYPNSGDLLGLRFRNAAVFVLVELLYQKGGKERVGYLHILLLQGASRVPIVIASSCASCGFGTPRQPEA